ncbi:cobalt-zinc-cadmium efflux system membrane fusion protein [Aquimarina sp. EL_43]|uniref:efflux RND transporter periplasmic adaptor subunit n=1 Tax=unclassified Aquimarina TaxID=2627091 RepID=UPI0018C90491|nr:MULTISPECIES: efflux RND transporter periplasmic adaptor subunit [unclassified Aquimarina]MBG6133179.1 cobalt-zinc-cadmium efflux system membrane fusion protein [Aquimarina sp. EL_35]MBG6153337.1 cobalt-zinc-cadmium efflux system membrane fusion protein [Aquimarina sp. EL_32]MBG6171394.1 cobalt-zinc-cadmium efflux system membrane fusion protein [Aquimarina sp. EL_43]
MKTNIYKLIAIFILLLILGCNNKPTTTSEEKHEEGNENLIELTDEQMKQTQIEIGKAQKRKIGNELSVNGMIDVPPQSNLSITVPYGGFLKFTDMLPGTRLRKGQLVARVENPDFIEFQRDYLEAVAKNEYLKADYKRQETLNKENVSSTKVFQKAKSDYLINKANIQALESKLKMVGINPSNVNNGRVSSMVNVYSPINGVVREVYVNTGKYFGSEDVLMDITNAEDLHVELKVYEDDIPLIKNEQRIRFRLANEPDKWMEAEVFLIGNNVSDDRSITIHGHLKEKNQELLPGMFVNAKIEVGAREAYAVPEEAIVRFDGNHYVFAAGEKRNEGETMVTDFEMIPITKGTEEEGFVAITLEDKNKDISIIRLVIKDAFTILGKAKNSEEGGHGHGH